MICEINIFKFCGYLQGNFLCRVHAWVRKSVKILIAVVLGALFLAGLYSLFGEVVMPTLIERIEEMFNYAV